MQDIDETNLIYESYVSHILVFRDKQVSSEDLKEKNIEKDVADIPRKDNIEA